MAEERAPAGSQIARHGLLYTVGVLVQGLATLLVIPLATRLLGPEQYGHVAVGLSIIQIGAVLAVAGLPAAITRAYFEPGDGLVRARAMMGLTVGMGLIVMAAALLLEPVTGAVISLSVASVGATTLVSGGQAVLRAQGRPVLFMLMAIGSTVGAHLIGLGAARFDRTANTYLTGYLVGAMLSAVLVLVIVPPVRPWRVPGAVGEGLRIALPVLPHSVGMIVLNSGDPLIVSRLLDPAQAGRYQVAMMLGIAPLAVLSGINNAWAPAIMGAPSEDRWALLARTVRPILWVAVVCALGVALLAPLAVHVLAPPSYGHRLLAQLAQIMSLCALSQVIYLGASSVIFNQKRTTALAITTPLATLLFVGISIPLVTWLGLPGMAIAKVIGFAALACATVFAAGRLAHVPWHATTWLPVMSVGLLGVLVLQFVPSSGAALWLQAGAAAVLGLVFAVRLARSGMHVGAAVDL
ncbi:MAG: lipopolysaccharide biosynthesis protein [Blastococcus sp.]